MDKKGFSRNFRYSSAELWDQVRAAVKERGFRSDQAVPRQNSAQAEGLRLPGHPYVWVQLTVTSGAQAAFKRAQVRGISAEHEETRVTPVAAPVSWLIAYFERQCAGSKAPR